MNEVVAFLEKFLGTRMGETLTRGLLEALYAAVLQELSTAAPAPVEAPAADPAPRGPGRPPKVA